MDTSFEDSFYDAVISHNVEELERILKCNKPADFDIDQILPSGATALVHAVSEKNVEMVRLLVSRGANVYLKTVEGETYLHLAVYSKCLELVKLFAGCISWAEKDGIFCSPLQYVYYKCDVKSDVFAYVAKLLSDDSNQDMIKEFNNIIMYKAAKKKKLVHVEILLKKGADPNYVTQKGISSFQMTYSGINNGSYSLFKLFLSRGADVFVNNRDDSWSPLIYALVYEYDRSNHQLRYILQKGVDPNEKVGDDYIWFRFFEPYYSCKNMPEEMILEKLRLLVEYGADMNLTSNTGHSCFFSAVSDNRIKVVRYLLSVGVDTYLKNRLPPIVLGVWIKSYEMIEFLFDQPGMSIDGVQTKLGKAVQNMLYCGLCAIKDSELRFRIIKLLVRRGTNLSSFLNLQFGRRVFCV